MMRTRSRTRLWVESIGYGLLVLAGAALLGFVVAPLAGIASGLFPIDVEAYGFFSLLTLKGTPTLVALSAVSGLLQLEAPTRRLRLRVLLLAVNVLLVWSIAAAIALYTLE